MALYEVPFTSSNGRDQIQAWIYEPVGTPRAIVQLIHGLGEHSRRYIRLISALLDAGFVVAADDHAGHGRTAMVSGVWQDAGEDGATVVVDDEQTLRREVTSRYPDLPYVVFGHSWGSMIARSLATRYPQGLAGLALCGVAAGMRGMENPQLRPALDAAIAAHGGDAIDQEGIAGGMFEGFLDRFGPDAGPTAWVAADARVVADHARDPLNNFGAPMTLRFGRSFVELYDRANADSWVDPLPKDLPVLILAGDQDPVANFGQGAYQVAAQLWDAGFRDVRTRVYTGVRHEVHNEPETRDDATAEIIGFVQHCAQRIPRVLFVCSTNSGKSQMAAALTRLHAKGRVQVYSAGVTPGQHLNEQARASVERLGASCAGEFPKPIDPTLLAQVDKVVLVGSNAQLDTSGLRASVERWTVDEPSTRGIQGDERMDLIRDELDQRAVALVAQLTGD